MSSSSAVWQNSTEHAEVLQSDSPHCVFKMPASAVYTGGDISSTGDDAGAKARKPYTITKQRERWTEDEHAKFLEALKLYGRAWRHIEEHVGTKTAVQIRSHAQKFFSKIEREASNGGPDGKLNEMEIPPPRPKKKPNHPYPRKASTMVPATYIPCDATKTQEEPVKVATQAVYSTFSETKEVETLAPLKEMMGCSGSPPSSNGSKTAASLQLFGKRMVLLDPKAGDGVNSKRKEGFSPYVQNEDISDLMSSSGTYVGNGRSYSRCQIEPATTLEGTGESMMTNASGFNPFQPRDTTEDLQGLGESDTNLDYMSRKRLRPSPSPRPSDGSIVDASYSNSVGFIAPPLLSNPGERFHHSMMMMMTMMPPWQLLQMAALGWLPGFVPPPPNLVVTPTNLADSSLFGSEPTNLPPELLSYPPDISIAAAAASAWWAMHGGIPPPGLLYGGCNHLQQDEANIATEKVTAEGTSSARWVAVGRKEKQGREGSSSGSYSPPHENETSKPVDSRCRSTSAKAGLVTNVKKEAEEKDDDGKKRDTDSDNDNDSNKNIINNDIDNGIDIDKNITRGISNGESEKDIPVSHSRFHKGQFRPSGRGFVPYCRPSPRSPKKVDAAKECFQRTPKS